MSDIVEIDGNHVQRAKLDGSRLQIHTKFYDDATLKRNQTLRNADLLNKAKMQLHDNEDIRFMISCPSQFQWQIFKKRYPDLHKGLHSQVEHERMSAARKIAILEPTWVVQTRF